MMAVMIVLLLVFEVLPLLCPGCAFWFCLSCQHFVRKNVQWLSFLGISDG